MAIPPEVELLGGRCIPRAGDHHGKPPGLAGDECPAPSARLHLRDAADYNPRSSIGHQNRRVADRQEDPHGS